MKERRSLSDAEKDMQISLGTPFFFSQYIFMVQKFSLFNGHQAVGMIEMCSYTFTDR